MLDRWRTSRGFGVHSPLAFELITQVLCDDTAVYYATASMPSRRSRRWLRLFARLNPVSVLRLGAPLSELDKALLTACPRADMHSTPRGDETLVIAVGADAPALRPAASLTAPRLAVLLVDTGIEALEALPRRGGRLSFSDRREHLAVRMTTPVTQHFNISMR